MANKRVAAIDCGTNSIRLLVAEQVGGKLMDLYERQTNINRLGQGVDKTGLLDPDALERTFEFERDYAKIIEKCGILTENVRFVATSATRDAKNRKVFFETTQKILGVTPEVISGDEEASLSFAGVVSALDDDVNKLVVDLGGGSTELIIGDKTPMGGYSMNIGSVRITERYFGSPASNGPEVPNQSQIEAARVDVQKTIELAFSELDARMASIETVEEIIGVAGTVTTLTAFIQDLPKYSREMVSGVHTSVERMIEAAEEMLHTPKSRIRQMPFVHPGRVDVLQAGCLIWGTLLEMTRDRVTKSGSDIVRCITSEHDILDGIALNI